MKNFKLSLLALALAVYPMSVFAAVPWTGAPSSSVVDESSTSLYALDAGALKFNSGTGTIVARMNVTDTTASGYPNWTTMEFRGYDPGASSSIMVRLFRYSPGGSVSNVATCSSSDSSTVQAATCSILNAVDFNSGNTYEVVIELGRTSTSVSPFIYGIRLY